MPAIFKPHHQARIGQAQAAKPDRAGHLARPGAQGGQRAVGRLRKVPRVAAHHQPAIGQAVDGAGAEVLPAGHRQRLHGRLPGPQLHHARHAFGKRPQARPVAVEAQPAVPLAGQGEGVRCSSGGCGCRRIDTASSSPVPSQYQVLSSSSTFRRGTAAEERLRCQRASTRDGCRAGAPAGRCRSGTRSCWECAAGGRPAASGGAIGLAAPGSAGCGWPRPAPGRLAPAASCARS